MSAYFLLGFTHILDLKGYDHMLFIAVLLSGVPLQKWKQMLLLITAFTVGHTVTLAITTLAAPILSSELVEFLIPVTILITGINNLRKEQSDITTRFVLVFLFGLIHGMGFAGYLSLLLPSDSQIWQPLLFFNLGVEAGQIIFASILGALLFSTRFISNNAIRIAQKSLTVAGIGIYLI